MKLNKSYANFNLNIEIPSPSGLNCFIGKNGSGKTTALLEIKKLYEVQHKVCFISSETFPKTRIYVKELLEMSDIKINDRYLNKLGINDLFDRRIKDLSKGENRLLYFLISISQDFDILLVDELFSHLDSLKSQKVLGILAEISLDKIVFFSCHTLDYKGNIAAYYLENGSLKDKYINSGQNDIIMPNDTYLAKGKGIKLIFFHHFFIFLFSLIISFVLCLMFCTYFSYGEIEKVQIKNDTLGIFNTQNELVLLPNSIELDDSKVFVNLTEISNEYGLKIVDEYYFCEQQILAVDDSIYNMELLYEYNSSIEGYYSTMNNPYLIKYFKSIKGELAPLELLEYIRNYDYSSNDIELTVFGVIYGTYFSKTMRICGIAEGDCFFVSNVPVFDFYKELKNDIVISNKKEKGVMLVESKSLEYDGDSSILTDLTLKYDYCYEFNSKGNIVVSGEKKITNEEYINAFKSNNVLAYSFETNRFALKDTSFFKTNDFSYIGDLNIDNNNVIVSENALSDFEISIDKSIGSKIIINGKGYNISAVLTGVSDKRIYFNEAEYINNISPKYCDNPIIIFDYFGDYSADKIKIENSLDVTCFGTRRSVDYEYLLEDLSFQKNKLLNSKTLFIIVFAIASIILIFATLFYLFQSYNFNKTLLMINYKHKKEKVIIVLIGILLVASLGYAFVIVCNNCIQNWMLSSIINSLDYFSLNKNRIMLSENYYFIIAVFIFLMGELINGKIIFKKFNNKK